MWKIRSNILSLAYNIITDESTTFTDGQLLLDKYKQIEEEVTKIVSDRTNYSLMRISKTMSYVLRHGVKELGIAMDDEARILVSDLLALPNMSKVSIDELIQVVDNNDKKRFEVQTVNGNLMIRAVQGHSKIFNDVIDEEKLLDEIIMPLEKCIHGTDSNAWEIIKKDGLKPISRMNIHCAISEPEDDQVISGMRTSAKVLIYIDMKKAMVDGIKFYVSILLYFLTKGQNGVLDPKYFNKVIKK